MPAPDPTRIYPDVYGPNGGRAQPPPKVVFLKPLVEWPLTDVGEYTYYADPDDPTAFERNNVLYHYGPERLVIGRFCAIAAQVRFIMNAANHRMDGVSSYPFPMMGGDWHDHMDLFASRPVRHDTVVGNDVWLGYRVTVMPGVHIGDGAIVASESVVSEDVPPYAVVGGNPARVLRRRFGEEDVERLQRLRWWDWPIEHVTAHVPQIMTGDVDTLERVAEHIARPAGHPTPPATDGSTR
jgi:virginiamycin A acetyltransferase